MTALLIGLLVVAIGATGTWFALFRLDPVRETTPADPDQSDSGVAADTSPRMASSPDTHHPDADFEPEGTTAAPQLGHELGSTPSRIPLKSGDVRISGAKRARSTVILVLLSLAAAGTIGAIAAAMLVVVVMVVT